MIFEKTLSTINKYNLIEKGDKIVLGLSGGPDSVCLLHILHRLKEVLDIEVYAAHLNHQIRGIEAQKDALYISQLSDDLGVTLFVKSMNVPEYCKENKLSVEEGARKLRYEMFFEIKERLHADKIAIAHNMNDQAETVLMRMMRGTGLQGLKGIDIIRDEVIIRPILEIERADIESYCEQYKLNPRIDSTNLESIYTRNKIRLELIPFMRDNFNSNIIESIVRMSNGLRNDNEFIEEEALRMFDEVSLKQLDSIEIYLDEYINLHKSLKSRIIRHGIKYVLGDTNFIDQKHIEEVIEFEAESKIDKKLILPRGLFIYRQKDKLIFTTKEIIVEEVEFSYKIPTNGFVKISEANVIVETETMSIKRYKALKRDKTLKWFDCNKIKGGMVVRSRRSGDKIKLSMGSKKIKELFIDLKIPKEERSRIPIVQDDTGIVCVGDFRNSEEYKVDETTKEVLKICFKKIKN
ncbi:MAG: tRNA lysidine(34) synthetase TilS [Peptostreptococcaceae bacterium]